MKSLNHAAREQGRSLQRARLGAVALLLCALVVAPFALPGFLLFQLSITLSYAIAVLGINLMLGFNGQVALAQGAFFAVGAYATAILHTAFGVPLPLALLAGVFAAAALGLVVGVPALRLPGLQLAIVTFGLAALAPQVIIKFTDITKGVSGISFTKPAVPSWLAASEDQWLYLLVLVALLASCYVVWRILRGDTGRTIRALRDGPLVAASLGINATRVRLSVFVVSSALGGLAGGMFAMLNGYINPDSFQAVKSIEFVIAAVVGGLTSIAGAFIGAAFIVFVPEWAGSANPALGALVYGIALLVMILIAPRGVIGLLERLFVWCQRRWESATSASAPTPVSKMAAVTQDLPHS